MLTHPISPLITSSDNTPIFDPSSTHGGGANFDFVMPVGSQCMLKDQLVAMLMLERTYQVDRIACRNVDADEASRMPHGDWRRKICEWSYRVVDHFRIDREVVSVTMNLFDRFLALHKDGNVRTCQCPSCKRTVDSKTFQLAAMTSLYLAIKVHAETAFCVDDEHQDYAMQPRRKKMKLLSFVELSRGQFSQEDLCSMERKILATLGWKVNPSTASVVITHFLGLLPQPSEVDVAYRPNYNLVLHVLNELARYLAELSVCLPNLSSDHLPSEIAFAAILVSMDMLTARALPCAVRETFFQLIANISNQAGSYLSRHSDRIRNLMDCLHQCICPEMLLDGSDNSMMGCDHSFVMAREAGLLDMQQIMRNTQSKGMNRKGSTTSVMHLDEDDDDDDEIDNDLEASSFVKCISP